MKQFQFLALAFALLMSTAAFAGYNIGDQAADFNLKGVDGKMHSLASIEDAKGYIVIFTCNHCPYAVKYEDRINAIHAKYAAEGYPVVAINPNDPEIVPGDDFKGMVKRAKEKNFEFLYLMDEGQTVYPQFGATRTPQVYLLNANREVQYIGAIDDNVGDASAVKEKYLENAIELVKQNKKPYPATTKAIGCTIKAK